MVYIVIKNILGDIICVPFDATITANRWEKLKILIFLIAGNYPNIRRGDREVFCFEFELCFTVIFSLAHWFVFFKIFLSTSAFSLKHASSKNKINLSI